jgi:hypothetical protein
MSHRCREKVAHVESGKDRGCTHHVYSGELEIQSMVV